MAMAAGKLRDLPGHCGGTTKRDNRRACRHAQTDFHRRSSPSMLCFAEGVMRFDAACTDESANFVLGSNARVGKNRLISVPGQRIDCDSSPHVRFGVMHE